MSKRKKRRKVSGGFQPLPKDQDALAKRLRQQDALEANKQRRDYDGTFQGKFTYAGRALKQGKITAAEVERFVDKPKNFKPRPTRSRFDTSPEKPWQRLNETQWEKAEEYIYVEPVNGQVVYDKRLELIMEDVTISALVRLAFDCLRYVDDPYEEFVDWDMVRTDYLHEIGRPR